MSDKLGTEQRPLRVAIVGSGPSGFYAAESLFSKDLKVKVDMFDRLPAPFGLVRYGVAPDHFKIKNVIKVYEKTAANEQFSFFGNVNIGRDISITELKKHYDAIIFTCGAETDKKLGIPGEDLANSHTATEFVAWYNGHPDYKDRKFDLTQKTAFVIGQGNVAMDVARILCKTVDELKTTDIAQHALDALADSKIEEVYMIGRRGPVQAAFTPPEIREFGELADCAPVLTSAEMEINEASQIELDDPKNAARKKNWDILSKYVDVPSGDKKKKFVIRFLRSPVEIKGNGKVESVVLETNELSGEANKQKARGSGKTEEVPCGIFFRSVGYRGVAIEGVPFRDDWGIFPNEEGRITDNDKVVLGLYCAGWIKRGPSGVIGTNKPDSVATVENLISDLSKLEDCPDPRTESVISLLKEKGICFVDYDGWKKIDAVEISRGEKIGKPREKFISVEDMLAVIK